MPPKLKSPTVVQTPDKVPEKEQVPAEAQEVPAEEMEVPEHLQGIPTKLSETNKQSCFICGRFLSTKHALIRHLEAERKIPLHFKDNELIEQIDAYIQVLKTKQPRIDDNLKCRHCERDLNNKYYRRQHEFKCRFNPTNRYKPLNSNYDKP